MGVGMSVLSEKLGIASDRVPDGPVVVRLVGALGAAGAARLIEAITLLDPHAGDRVVLHLDDETFLDPAGVGALCYAEAFVRARGGLFAISTGSPRVHAMLELAGLGRWCEADDTRQTPEAGSDGGTHRPRPPAVPR